MKITDFYQVHVLHLHGIDICKGCPYEHAASCHEGRYPQCTEQYEKIRTDQTDEICRDAMQSDR
mgnify:FL=1